jgi:hypothetical protein
MSRRPSSPEVTRWDEIMITVFIPLFLSWIRRNLSFSWHLHVLQECGGDLHEEVRTEERNRNEQNIWKLEFFKHRALEIADEQEAELQWDKDQKKRKMSLPNCEGMKMTKQMLDTENQWTNGIVWMI